MNDFPLYDYNTDKIIEYSQYTFIDNIEKQREYIQFSINKFKEFFKGINDEILEKESKHAEGEDDFGAFLSQRDYLFDCIKKLEKYLKYLILGSKQKKENLVKETSDLKTTNNSKKIRWLGTDEEILILCELLWHAGYIDAKSYKYCQSLIPITFMNRDYDVFQRDSLNVRKHELKEDIIPGKDYRLKKFKIMEDIVGRIDQVHDNLEKEWQKTTKLNN